MKRYNESIEQDCVTVEEKCSVTSEDGRLDEFKQTSSESVKEQ